MQGRTSMALAATALLLSFATVPHIHAAEPYVSFAFGYAGEEISAGTVGVNHPTRCDALLYANRQDAPSDAACSHDTPGQMFSGSFDFDSAFAGAASAGYAWNSWRVEIEFLHRAHGSQQVPAIPAAGNQALLGKESEWSAHSPPYYRISDFKVRQLFVNALYAFDAFAPASSWSPYVGLGVGMAGVAANYRASYQRSTVAEGYVAAAGGDPAQPTEWQLAAAGSISTLDTDLDERAVGYQIFAGLDRDLSDKATLFVMARWSTFGEVDSNDVWTTVRSHAPVQADGVTPFRTDQTLEDIGGIAVTVGLRYAL